MDRLDRSHGEIWVRTSCKLSGSMCPACLLELEEKLRAIPGIAFIKITRPKTPANPPQSPAAASPKTTLPDHAPLPKLMADAIIIFDNRNISFDRLEQFMKREKYKPVDAKTAALQGSQTQ